MSTSTVYNAIVAKAVAVLTDSIRLENPYELSDNPSIVMKNGWGLKVGPIVVIPLEFNKLSTAREYKIILARLMDVFIGTTQFDAISISLMDNQQSILGAFHSPDELSIGSSIDQIEVEEATGLEFVESKEKKYLFCEITFRITTSEAVT